LCQAESLAIVPGTIPIASIVADSSTATGLAWAAPAGGGKVLQVISATTSTATTISSSSFTDTTITATITPTSATSKILVIVSACSQTYKTASGTITLSKAQLLRGATVIGSWARAQMLEHSTNSTDLALGNSNSYSYLDSPATTSSTTYKLQAGIVTGAAVVFQNASTNDSTITLLEIGA
jgi:hypothetical protein